MNKRQYKKARKDLYKEVSFVKNFISSGLAEDRFSAEDLLEAVESGHKCRNYTERVFRHVVCAGTFVRSTDGYQFMMPATRDCLDLAFTSKGTRFLAHPYVDEPEVGTKAA